MSTPRTDEREKDYWDTPTSHVDDVWEFARELERENAALREDKARMDYLACGFDFPKLYDGKWHCFSGEFFTLREAIDAERKEAQP